MPKARSRFEGVTWGQIQQWGRQHGIRGLPSQGDEIRCFRENLPIRGRHICFMTLTRGPVQGVVIVLAGVASRIRGQKLRLVEWTRATAPKLFIKAVETATRLQQLELEEEGGARQPAEQGSLRAEPAPFAAKVVSLKKRHTKRRSVRVRFRVPRARIAG